MAKIETDGFGRPLPPLGGDEAATLLGFLDYQRATTAWRCRGLTDGQLRTALPPTSMTLAGMLKHLARYEDHWFGTVIGGRPMPEPWAAVDWDGDPDWEWNSAAHDPGDALRALWAERVERSRVVVREQLEQVDALGGMHPAWGGEGHVSLRFVLVHMIEEYARHNGHADLLRESIDGETGE